MGRSIWKRPFASLTVLFCTAMLAGNTSAEIHHPGTCPPDHPKARAMAIAFLDGPSFADDAAALGMTAADSLTMRVLSAPGDSIACEQLGIGMAMSDVSDYPWVHSFYQVRGYYIVGIGVHPDAESRRNADGTISVHLMRSFVAVVDSTFRIVGSY